MCVCVCMQICMTYVFSQETFVRGTKTRFFLFHKSVFVVKFTLAYNVTLMAEWN